MIKRNKVQPLSPTYHPGLIQYVIQTKSFQCLKHVVLSSQEMSDGFSQFMLDIFVSYDRGSFCFKTTDSNILVRYYVSWYFKNWLTPFIRKLWINRTTPRSEETGFLEDVYRYKKIVALNGVKLNSTLLASPVIYNLMSIPRLLTLDYWLVDFVHISLRRFKSVLLTFKNDAHPQENKFEPFKNDVDFRESNILELVDDNDTIPAGCTFLLQKIDFVLKDTRHLIFTENSSSTCYTTSKIITELIDELTTTHSNIESVRIGIRLKYLSTDLTTTMKAQFDEFLPPLRESNPATLKVKMIFLCDAKSATTEGPFFTSDVFPLEDFDITPDGQVCTNRQTKISENVEFIFRCES